MRIVMLGAPCAGKGTQAAKLAQRLQISHLSTGEMLRKAVASSSAIGLAAKDAMDRGQLVRDEIITGCVEEGLHAASASSGFILDGFPRTTSQASMLDDLLKRQTCPLDIAFELVVNEEELLRRIKSRAELSRSEGRQARSDDNPKIFAQRMTAYHSSTAPVSDYYQKRGLLHRINGLLNAEAVTEEIARLLKL